MNNYINKKIIFCKYGYSVMRLKKIIITFSNNYSMNANADLSS